MTICLEIKNVTVKFRGLVAVDKISFSVKGNTIFGIVGPNGAGKSTLFNVISGLYTPENGGDVLLNGESLIGLKPHRIAAKGISRTFQNTALFMEQTVEENVKTAQHLHIRYSPFLTFLPLPFIKREELSVQSRTDELLAYLELTHLRDHYVHELTNGQRKLVEIARALALQPKIILMDEPVAGLNSQEADHLKVLIKQLVKDKEMIILLIEHNMNFLMQLSEEVFVMNSGQTVMQGTPNEVQTNKRVKEIYLGGS